MPFLRARALRSWAATLCVALVAVLVVQAPIATVDQAQHDQGIAHRADAMAGQVLAHADADMHGHEHIPVASDDGDEGDVGPVSHHHLSDAPQLWLADQVDAELPRRVKTNLLPSTDCTSPTSRIFGLERPPRTAQDRIA